MFLSGFWLWRLSLRLRWWRGERRHERRRVHVRNENWGVDIQGGQSLGDGIGIVPVVLRLSRHRIGQVGSPDWTNVTLASNLAARFFRPEKIYSRSWRSAVREKRMAEFRTISSVDDVAN
jgi:hypothetical protein